MFPRLACNSFMFEDIRVGDSYSFERLIDKKLVEAFADISGDYNPLHMDEEYARTTVFGGQVVHGMLLASFFSAMVGMLCPGLRCLYLSQDIKFKKPVLVNSLVIVMGTVTGKSDATKILVIKTLIKDKQGIIFVEGEARVKVGYEYI